MFLVQNKKTNMEEAKMKIKKRVTAKGENDFRMINLEVGGFLCWTKLRFTISATDLDHFYLSIILQQFLARGAM